MSNDFPFENFLKQAPNLLEEKNQLESDILAQNQKKDIVDNSSKEIEKLEHDILEQLKDSIPTAKFNTYFTNTFRLGTILPDTVEFYVSTPFIKDMINDYYITQVSDAVLSCLGKKYNIRIDVKKSNKSLSSNTQNILNTLDNDSVEISTNMPRPKSAKDIRFSLDLNPTRNDMIDKIDSKYLEYMESGQNSFVIDPLKNFDSFIIGPSNNIAYAMASAVAKTPGKSGKYPCLYIYSNSGLGKTHLLHAVANGIRKNHPYLAICLITARDFMREMVNAISDNRISDFQKKYSEKIDVLMVDDIHDLQGKNTTQNEFFHVFNALYNSGKQLIFTSDKTPSEIEGIEKRIISRLEWGHVVDIQQPDLETRIAILRRKVNELDFQLADDVLTLIATHIKDSIRSLEGALNKLSAYSNVMRVDLDIEMVRELLKIGQSTDSSNLTLESIAKLCSQHFKITVADLKSKSRSKNIVYARHIAVYLSRKILQASLQEIGKFYGNRDHTSILYAVEKITSELSHDQSLSKDVMSIESSF